ncbi:MAG: acyltransferase [Bacteroidetes bacterium]|nr:acyltransferase [Bacteroidota bacterium]MBS1649269.1 acyltransferase [Bacteroidota bacterium]
MKYIKAFDTLRAFAVTFVIINHSFPNTPFIHKIAFGEIGVFFFFVLSGFLITTILLNEKEQTYSTKRKIGIFYIRRALRIFPAYYLFLYINFLFQQPDLIKHTTYFLTYTQSFLFFKTASYAGALSPTWTLAVEEQFYLLWPFIILFTPKMQLQKIIIGCILFSPLFRICVAVIGRLIGQNTSLSLALMPSNMLCLCSGALLAYTVFYDKETFLYRILSKKIFILSIIIYLAIPFFITKNLWMSIVRQTFMSIISLYIILTIVKGKSKYIHFLHNKITVYLGKISYGMYLYHTVAIPIISNILLKLLNIHIGLGNSDLHDFFLTFSTSVIVASASWFLFEKPINMFKRKFSY